MYNPGITDQRGQFYFQGKKAYGENMAAGISQATSAIAGGITQMGQNYQMTQAELSTMGGKAAAYQQVGLMTEEQLQAFQTGNMTKKREIMSQMDTQYALQIAQQQQQQQNWAPSADSLNQLRSKGYEYFPTGPGKGTWDNTQKANLQQQFDSSLSDAEQLRQQGPLVPGKTAITRNGVIYIYQGPDQWQAQATQ